MPKDELACALYRVEHCRSVSIKAAIEEGQQAAAERDDFIVMNGYSSSPQSSFIPECSSHDE